MVLIDIKGAFNRVWLEKLYKSIVKIGVLGYVVALVVNIYKRRLAFLRRE